MGGVAGRKEVYRTAQGFQIGVWVVNEIYIS